MIVPPPRTAISELQQTVQYEVVVTADDGNGGTVTDTFVYTVSNVAPDAQDDALTGDEDTTNASANVISDNGSGADSDADGDAL